MTAQEMIKILVCTAETDDLSDRVVVRVGDKYIDVDALFWQQGPQALVIELDPERSPE